MYIEGKGGWWSFNFAPSLWSPMSAKCIVTFCTCIHLLKLDKDFISIMQDDEQQTENVTDCQ